MSFDFAKAVIDDEIVAMLRRIQARARDERGELRPRRHPGGRAGRDVRRPPPHARAHADHGVPPRDRRPRARARAGSRRAASTPRGAPCCASATSSPATRRASSRPTSTRVSGRSSPGMIAARVRAARGLDARARRGALRPGGAAAPPARPAGRGMSDLTQLPLEELLEQIQDNLYGGKAEPVVAGVHELLRRGLTPYDALTKGLIAGMDVVGEDFRTGKLFVPQVLMAAKAMKARHGGPPAAPGRDRGAADRHARHRDGQGRHPRHREEPGRDDDGGRGLPGGQPRDQHRRREVPPRRPRARGRHPRDERAPHDDHAVHAGRHPGAQGGRPPREADRAGRRRAAQRRLRQVDRRRRLLPGRREGRRDGEAPHGREDGGAVA